MTWARLLMCSCLRTSMPAASSEVISSISAPGSIDDAVADDGLHARAKNAAGDQLQDVLLLADEDGVAGVVAALIARDDVEALGEEVDDLALAFVAPLGAENDDVFHCAQTPYFSVQRDGNVSCSESEGARHECWCFREKRTGVADLEVYNTSRTEPHALSPSQPGSPPN